MAADRPGADRSAASRAGAGRAAAARARDGGTASGAGGEGSGTAARRVVDRADFWARTLRGWDVAFYVMIAIACASFVADDGGATATTASLAAMAALVTAYTVLGRRAALRGDGRLAHAYLAVLLVVVVLVVGLEPMGTLLLFIAYSQVWFFSERRSTAAGIALVLAVGASVAMGVRGRADQAAWVEITGQMGIGLMFSVLLGLWITQIAEQSEERAGLIERLEAAQAELAATHHAAGVLAERERLAQEIHDTLAQGFTSVVMLAQTAAAELDRGALDAVRGRVEQIEDVSRENLAEARALVAAFGPAGLERSGLRDALARLAVRFQAETGVRVEVDLTGGSALPRDTEVVLLRGAQEALANVRKHAAARRVHLRLTAEDGTVELEVHDDGRGLPARASEGVGLRGMHERVRAGGGTLDVGSPPGGGTRVLVRMPVGPDRATAVTDDRVVRTASGRDDDRAAGTGAGRDDPAAGTGGGSDDGGVAATATGWVTGLGETDTDAGGTFVGPSGDAPHERTPRGGA